MNILFEIADQDLMIIGVILVIILIVATVIFKIVNKNNKVLPINENERFDNDKTEDVAEVTDEQQKAKDELQRVFNQMSEDLENNDPKPDEIDNFEREQEESAIISYQELMKQADTLKASADNYEMKAEEKADTSMPEATTTYKEHAEEKVVKPAYQGFHNSDIISPIYGIKSSKEIHEEKISPKMATNGIIDKAYEGIKKSSENEQNVDFLNSLKEFRKNL
jgi:hypothetical protein